MTGIGDPEWAAGQQARELLAQDAARETLRQQQAQPVSTRVDTEADERRAAALQQAYAARGAQRMGRDVPGEALLLPHGGLAAVRRKDGMIAEMAPGVATMVLVRPEQWDAHDLAFRAQRRLDENILLAWAYGRARCIAEGWISTEDAAQLPPEPPPNPNGAPYSLTRSVG